MATTREDHSPSTRDRARVVERERDSGEGRYERGDASGPHQRREGGEVLGNDVDGERSDGGRSGAERAALRDGVDPRLRGLPALFSISEPYVSFSRCGCCRSLHIHAKRGRYFTRRREALPHHPCVSSALLCCLFHHTPFTTVCLPLFCVVYFRCKARTRSSTAACTNPSRRSVLRVTRCGH